MQTLLNIAQFMLENMWRGAKYMDTHQVGWALLSAVIAIWLITHSGLVI